MATGADLASAPPQVAVIGIGAVEQHGRHLPVGTDFLAVRELSRRVAAELDAWLLPAIPFGMSECHGALEGTVWLKPATLAAVVRDLARSLEAQNVPILLVLNGHGGNFVLEPVIEQLNREPARLRVIMPALDRPPPPKVTVTDEAPIFETAGSEVHSGEVETSTQLHYNPQLVRDERVDGPITVGREFLDYTTMDRLNPEGVWGSPTRADAAKGGRAVAVQVRNIVRYFEDARAAISAGEA